jgi:hypothetical protein
MITSMPPDQSCPHRKTRYGGVRGALILDFILAGPLERKPVLPSQFVYWLMLNPLEIRLSCTIKGTSAENGLLLPAQSVSRMIGGYNQGSKFPEERIA